MKPDLVETVLPHEEGLMIKEIIYGRLRLSRGLLRRMRNGGQVCLNGRRAHITQRVKTGDKIEIYFADSATDLVPEPMELDIVYEDDSLLAVNKAPNIPVHPTGGYPSGTLANGIAHLWQQRGLKRKIRLLHRLDRETSGVILIAKEPYAYHQLVRQLRSRRLKRKYLAVIKGKLNDKQGIIDQPIGMSSQADHGLKRTVTDSGRPACSHYRVIQEYASVSLVELELVTGRTHQLRVHLSWMGNPIVGDEMYGQASSMINRQALHAWSLDFIHPRTEQPVQIRIPLPGDMKSILNHQLQQLQ